MRTIVKPTGGNFNALIPDAIASMYDEDLFIELNWVGDIPADGAIQEIRVSGKLYKAVVYNGKARVYIDDVKNVDAGFVELIINFGGSSSNYKVKLVPKKSIGDVADLQLKIPPLWNTSTLSFVKDVDILIEDTGADSLSAWVKSLILEPTPTKYKIWQSGTPEPSGWRYPRKKQSHHTAFEWITEDGNWMYWCFVKVEERRRSKSDLTDFVKQTSRLGNERVKAFELKKDEITETYSSGYEVREVLEMINSIKTSSFVFREGVRVNIQSEDVTNLDRAKEFNFSVISETKTAK